MLLQLTQLKGSQVTFGEKWYIYWVAFVLISNYLIFFLIQKFNREHRQSSLERLYRIIYQYQSCFWIDLLYCFIEPSFYTSYEAIFIYLSEVYWICMEIDKWQKKIWIIVKICYLNLWFIWFNDSWIQFYIHLIWWNT